MQKININFTPQKIYYPILVGQGFLQDFYAQIKDIKNISHYIIITDSNIKKLYGAELLKNLKAKKLKVDLLSFLAGEASKTQTTKTKLENEMLKKGCGRDTLVIALGGGVVGDMAGFVAATYMRGVPYVQVPTSLLAMADSSVGGKTGIDTMYGKNLIGAFWQPQKVIADINCLKSLPQKQFINGFIEALKMFVTNDAAMVKFCLTNIDKILARDLNVIEKIITKAIKIKSDIVAEDEREAGARMILNFGHTIGHAIETLSNYNMLHGHAVGLGMLAEAKIAQKLNLLSQKDYDLLEKLILSLGLDKKELQKYKAQDILKLIKLDKKARNGKAQFVLLEKVGKVYKQDNNYAHFVSDRVVRETLKCF